MNPSPHTPLTLLLVYCLAVFLASLMGGWLPTRLRLTHSRLQIAISFVGGLMLGLALLGMLPHALEHLGTALAVILHKPFGALAISTLMVASHTSRRSQRWVNLAFASVTPIGALLFFLGTGHLAHSHPAGVGAALGFCAGTFLCIACADLLPELQFHSHDRVKLSLALLAGIAVAVLIARYGHAHQSHRHDAATSISTEAILAPQMELRPQSSCLWTC